MPPNVVIGGLKCVNIVECKEDEFEPLFKELAVEVRKHDKRCNYYDLHSPEQPRTYLVMEQCEDKEPIQMHQKSKNGWHFESFSQNTNYGYRNMHFNDDPLISSL
jgi:quinol monooxygenase YgiN